MLSSQSLRHHHGRNAAAILSAEEVTMGGPFPSSSPKIFSLTSSQMIEESSKEHENANWDQQLQHFQEVDERDESDESERMSASASLLQRDVAEVSRQQPRKKLKTDDSHRAKDFKNVAIRKEKLKSESKNSGEIMNDEPVTAPFTGSPLLIHKIKVKPGHELKLKCDLNNTYGRIQWILNGNPIRTDNGRYAIQGPSSRDRSVEGRLTINNVLPEDNGVWQCHETKFNGKEHLSKAIWVIVLASPIAVHLELDGRPITPSTTSSPKITVREKENVRIQCVVEGGNPPPKVFWFVGSVNMTNSSQISSKYSEEIKVYITRSTLFLQNISRIDHNKSVLCLVEHELLNQAGESVRTNIQTKAFKNDGLLATPSLGLTSANLKAMARINVEYAPSFVISRIPGFGYPIREGTSMTLKCEVDANPKSSPQWVKDGGKPPVPQSPDGFMNFTEVSRNHSGWYKCISHHPHGNFSSVGYYLTVRCTFLKYFLHFFLIFVRVGLEEKRAQTSDILVVVIGRPVVYPTNRTIMGFTGQPLSLSVEMCANPPPDRTFWVFGNVALRPGSKYQNKYVAQKLSLNDRATDCYLAVLTILNASADDAGEYTFFVRNSKGVHEGTVLLDITPASYSVSNSRAYDDSPLFPTSPSSPSLQNLSLRILVFTSLISVIMQCLIYDTLLVT